MALGAGAALVAVGAAIGVWLVAGGGSSKPAGDPVVFLRGVVRQIATNDYEGAWDTLHPLQQRVAPRREYVSCEQLTPSQGHLDWIRTIGSKDERIRIAGADGTVESTAVRFRIKLSEPVLKAVDFGVVTAHAVAVDGRWRWILPARVFEKYRSKTCFGTGGPPSAT